MKYLGLYYKFVLKYIDEKHIYPVKQVRTKLYMQLTWLVEFKLQPTAIKNKNIFNSGNINWVDTYPAQSVQLQGLTSQRKADKKNMNNL